MFIIIERDYFPKSAIVAFKFINAYIKPFLINGSKEEIRLEIYINGKSKVIKIFLSDNHFLTFSNKNS